MSAIRIAYDIPGASCRIGWSAKVVHLNDFTFNHWYEILGMRVEYPNYDTEEFVVKSIVGLEGIIVHFEYGCGCGQEFPTDPMIGVCLRVPGHGLIVEEFWRDELDFGPPVRGLLEAKFDRLTAVYTTQPARRGQIGPCSMHLFQDCSILVRREERQKVANVYKFVVDSAKWYGPNDWQFSVSLVGNIRRRYSLPCQLCVKRARYDDPNLLREF